MAEIEKKRSRLAVKSFIYGLLCWSYVVINPLIPRKGEAREVSDTFIVVTTIYGWLSIFFVFQAIRLGIYGLKEIKTNPSTQKGTGFAITGILLGISMMLMLLAINIFFWYRWY